MSDTWFSWEEWPGLSWNILAYLNWGFTLFGLKLSLLVGIYGLWVVWYIAVNELQNKRRWEAIGTTANTLQKFHAYLNALEAKPKDPSQAIASFFHEYDMEELPETHPIHNLKHAYDEFLEGVHVYNDTTYNVYQAEDFFKAAVLFKPQLDAVAHQPGLATSTGLLFTFLALTCGLSELDYDKTTKLIAGLDGFINALSSKFITSLLGLGLAIWVSSRIQTKEHQLTEALNGITYELNRRFKRLTSQQVLIELQKDVHTLPQQIGSYLTQSENNDSFMQRLENLISENLNTAVTNIQDSMKDVRGDVQQVSQAMSGFSAQGFESLAEQFKQIGQELREGISSGVSKDLERLSEIMEKLPSMMQTTLDNLSTSMSAMRATLQETQRQTADALKELLREIQEAQGSNVEQLLESFMNKTHELNQHMVRQQEALQQKQTDGMAVLQDLLDTLTTQQQEAGSQLNEALNTQLTSLSTQFSGLLEQMKAQQTQQQHNVNEGTQAVLAKLTDALGTAQATLNAGVGESTETLNKAQGEFMAQVKDSLEAFRTLSMEALDRQEQQLLPVLKGLETTTQGLQRTVEELPKGLQEAQAQLTRAMEQLQQLVNNELQRFVESQGQLTHEQHTVLTDLRTIVADVTRLQQHAQGLQALLSDLIEIQKTVEASRDRVDTLTQDRLEQFTFGLDQQKQWLEQQQAVSEQLQQRYQDLTALGETISSTFGDAGKQMATSIKDITAASTGYFDAFTKQHTDALGYLKSGIDALQEALVVSNIRTPAS